MSTPVSQPVVPPQPNLAVFSTQQLALFTAYSRATYLSTFGVQAPAWDPTRLGKSWFDTTANTSQPGNVSVYNVVGTDANGNGIIQQLVISSSEAATVNLSGSITYAPFVIAPTDATRGGSGINPAYLSLQSDAQALMTVVGGTSIVDEGDTAVFPVVYPSDEPRRMWAILFNGRPENVGLMIQSQNANGVGSPGEWNLTGSDPIWVPAPSAPTGEDDTRPPRPMPVRALLPNEVLQLTLAGVCVARTDLQQAGQEASGEFTQTDRNTLGQILGILTNVFPGQ